jgi:hypothetical protein
MLSKIISYIRYRIDFETTKNKMIAKGFEVNHFAEISFRPSMKGKIEPTSMVIFRKGNLFEAYRFNELKNKTSEFPLFKSALVGNEEITRFNKFIAEGNFEYATMLLLAFTFDDDFIEI